MARHRPYYTKKQPKSVGAQEQDPSTGTASLLQPIPTIIIVVQYFFIVDPLLKNYLLVVMILYYVMTYQQNMIVKDFVLTKEKMSYIMNGVVIEVYPVLAPTQVDIQDTSGEILPLCHPTAYTLLKLKNCTLPINRKCHSSNFFFLTSSSMYILFCKLWLTIYCCLLF